LQINNKSLGQKKLLMLKGMTRCSLLRPGQCFFASGKAQTASSSEFVTRDDLEDRLSQNDDLQKNMAQLQEMLHIHHKKVESRLDSMTLRMARIYGESQELKRMMAHVTAGLGLKFERFNRAWLQHFLQAQGVITAQTEDSPSRVIQGHRERNLGPWTEVEIDLFCRDPALLVECTSFLRRQEMGKVERVARIRDLVSERYGTPFKAYFIALAVHARIRPELEAFCRTRDLHLITQFH